MHEDYPRLDELVGGYLNLDFDIIFKTTNIEDVVEIFVTRTPIEGLHQLMHEIADFESVSYTHLTLPTTPYV